jgi:ankyrin repeat protein
MIQQAGHGEIDIKDLATKLKNNNGETLLHVAAGTTYPDAVRYLIEKGADRKAQDIHDRIPFDIAHNTHHIPEIEDLLSVTGDSSAL